MWSVGKSLSLSFFISCALLGCEETTVRPLPPEGPPFLVIDEPHVSAPTPQYAKVIRFEWSASSGARPSEIRYLWSAVVDTNGVYNPAFDIIADLNAHPARYEAEWSRWISWTAPGDSGRATVLGDDETLQLGRYYIFALQARDREGRVTPDFTAGLNVQRFRITTSAMPLLVLYEQYLVGFRFLGTNLNPEERAVPPGIPLRFSWSADVSAYGGTVAGYRYAWDLVDPAAWDAPFDAGLTAAGEVTFYAGSHTLSVEAVDIAGNHTLARVIVDLVPFPMDRSLLFVDDYYSTDTPIPDYSNPTESAYDAFWLGICAKADGFDPARDVYDCVQHQLAPPTSALIGRYKNVIWASSADNSAWGKMILFTPESQVGKSGTYPINYLAMFLLRGGHLWTLGQGQRGGGLAACLSQQARSFPMNLACEITGNRDDCAGDRSGVMSMPYRDYCVTMLDKVDGVIRATAGMPTRSKSHFDCLVHALRNDADPLTALHPGLPRRLDLWEEVTKPGRYFDPNDSLGPGGLTYVEVYDPGYWMMHEALSSQPCFDPMYLMRAASDRSALNGCAVALWVAKYDDVVPDVASGPAVAAPSFHFGFPLWFFRRSSVDSIAAVVFDEWGILKAR
jgi:hypothetical protein